MMRPQDGKQGLCKADVVVLDRFSRLGFDENELKCAQTRPILTKMRSKLTGFDHFEPRFPRGYCIFDPPLPPPLFSSTSSTARKSRCF